jgi:peptidoglycan/LPS O-acetylase OafA/YrhL
MEPDRFDDGARRSPRYSLRERIDVCRGLFAALVVVGHSFDLARAMDPSWDAGMPRLAADFLRYTAGTGVYYVMGFFILSGYCIQASARRLSEGPSFPLGAYTMARATRILPLYYAALLFAVIVEVVARRSGWRPDLWLVGFDARTFAGQTLLIQGLTERLGSFAASWSITNEVVYYAFFGLVAAACAPLRVRPAVVGMVLCCVGGAALLASYRLTRDHRAMTYGSLIGLGAVWHLGALVKAYEPWIAARPRIGSAARIWPALLALDMGLFAAGAVHQEVVFVLAGAAFALMMVRFASVEAALVGRPAAPPRALPTALGMVSYPMYLFHGPLLLAFGTIANAAGIVAPWWAIWPAAASLAIAACLPLGRLLEAPVMAWRSGLMKRAARPADRPPAGPVLDARR